MKREDILKTANECVNGARQQDYGNPEDNFKKIGELWTAYTGHKYTPVDVSIMLLLMKVGRMSTGKGTTDTYVDICGYAACAGEIATEEKVCDSGVTAEEAINNLSNTYNKDNDDKKHYYPYPSCIYCMTTEELNEYIRGMLKNHKKYNALK